MTTGKTTSPVTFAVPTNYANNSASKIPSISLGVAKDSSASVMPFKNLNISASTGDIGNLQVI